MRAMGRTNIVIDDELVAQVMKLWDLKTKREAVDFALRMAAQRHEWRAKIAASAGSIPDLDIRVVRPGWEPPEEP